MVVAGSVELFDKEEKAGGRGAGEDFIASDAKALIRNKVIGCVRTTCGALTRKHMREGKGNMCM